MFALLPDLSPRDSHSLWYTSSRNPFPPSNTSDAHLHGSSHPDHGLGHGHPHGVNGNQQHQQHRRGAHLIERSSLARLRADEHNLERRRQNVTNFGSAWLKPPGLPKTLHQLREERREAEEHQEAMRREQLAQELAEAEAEAAGGGAAETGEAGDEGMDDVQLDGARDLDADIPEADDADFGLSSIEDDEDEDEEDGEDEDAEEGEEDDEEDEDAEVRAQTQQQQLMAQRMRQGNDAFREDMARGRDSAAFYGADEDIDEVDQSHMIEEDDLAGTQEDMDDMGMDADLDDEIPEAESLGGYEHTDTEAELSSSIDEGDNNNSNISFVQSQQANRFRHSLAQSDATRNSIAISDILSRDGSSVLGSSPAIPRQRPGGSSRRGRG
ncbi:Apc15p protein-domain-containing protein [Astrocystis sublimbata]|nr:Apc15p protein-domain-containing protein [Astrocystis sublimbata]